MHWMCQKTASHIGLNLRRPARPETDASRQRRRFRPGTYAAKTNASTTGGVSQKGAGFGGVRS